MKVVIAGGTGQVGTLLARAFHAEGREVVVLARHPLRAPWRVVRWDARTAGAWARDLDGAEAVINLAGRSVNCRYHERNRRDILRSRVDSVRAVAAAIARCRQPPRSWLQASTATVYAHRFDAANDEDTGRIGGSEPGTPASWRFSVDVARAWEEALAEAVAPYTRKVAMRTAMVMSPDRGGIFDVLLGLVRRGLGGPAAGGRQYVSWIHHEDFVEAVEWLLSHEEVEGPVNIASPEPLPQREFMRVLREAWGTRIGLPATGWMLEIGAVLMRTEPELVLKSRRVVPGKLLNGGFVFRYPHWSDAARDLVATRRGARPSRAW